MWPSILLPCVRQGHGAPRASTMPLAASGSRPSSSLPGLFDVAGRRGSHAEHVPRGRTPAARGADHRRAGAGLARWAEVRLERGHITLRAPRRPASTQRRDARLSRSARPYAAAWSATRCAGLTRASADASERHADEARYAGGRHDRLRPAPHPNRPRVEDGCGSRESTRASAPHVGRPRPLRLPHAMNFHVADGQLLTLQGPGTSSRPSPSRSTSSLDGPRSRRERPWSVPETIWSSVQYASMTLPPGGRHDNRRRVDSSCSTPRSASRRSPRRARLSTRRSGARRGPTAPGHGLGAETPDDFRAARSD